MDEAPRPSSAQRFTREVLPALPLVCVPAVSCRKGSKSHMGDQPPDLPAAKLHVQGSSPALNCCLLIEWGEPSCGSYLGTSLTFGLRATTVAGVTLFPWSLRRWEHLCYSVFAANKPGQRGATLLQGKTAREALNFREYKAPFVNC